MYIVGFFFRFGPLHTSLYGPTSCFIRRRHLQNTSSPLARKLNNFFEDFRFSIWGCVKGKFATKINVKLHLSRPASAMTCISSNKEATFKCQQQHQHRQPSRYLHFPLIHGPRKMTPFFETVVAKFNTFLKKECAFAKLFQPSVYVWGQYPTITKFKFHAPFPRL